MGELKQIRGQLRQIAKDILPGLLSEEVTKELHKSLQVRVDARLDAIEKHIRSVLEGIDQRAKDTQNYLIRQASSQAEFLLKKSGDK